MRSTDENSQEFARDAVPEEATGGGLKLFFIVAGSLCGLPVFVLSSQVTGALGLQRATLAFLVGAAVSGVLGALSASAGARTRMTLALLAEQTFGSWGAQLVKLAIALSLIGWFGVIVSVLGATLTEAVAQIAGWRIPPATIGIALSGLIALVVLKGIRGLERLGRVIVPLTLILLVIAVVMTLGSFDHTAMRTGSGTLSFQSAVSAVIGSYIVGIVIQPDYGRYIRQPVHAGLAAFAALGLIYPLILVMSALPSIALGRPDLIASLIALGIGVPALVLLLLGAWIDAAACLYSGSLSLANLFPRIRLSHLILAATLIGAALALMHVERQFMPYLNLLSVTLPPVAAVQCAHALTSGGHGHHIKRVLEPKIRWTPMCAWFAGTTFGLLSDRDWIGISYIAALDSIIAAVAVLFLLRALGRSRPAELSPNQA